MEIQEFVSRIDGFIGMSSSEVIPYFGYYCTKILGNESFTAKMVEDCFNKLCLPKYSNISAYLSKSAKSKKLIKHKNGGYNLTYSVACTIDDMIGKPQVKSPSDELFPLEIFDNTRDYLKKTGRQAVLCYDYGLYDACLVMVRRILETLIIELFEKKAIADRIKDLNGHYFFCEKLIGHLLKERTLWTIGRNSFQYLPRIKEFGDLSAHNRRFNATKSDIDKIKDGLRIAIEEIVHLIDYNHQ